MPLENPFSFSLGAEASNREREKKRYLGTPQTPAGGPLHPLGRGIALELTPLGVSPIGVNLSGVPRGSRPLAGYKGCPLEISLFLSRAAAGGAGEEKKALWEDPCTPLGKGFALKLTPLAVSPHIPFFRRPP